MRRVLLIGCTGSGRTAVGTAVAGRAGWPFLDDDVLIERTSGYDVRTLFARDGLEGLTAAGAATLTLLLAIPGPLVGAVSSAVALDEAGRDRLRQSGHVVWLRASLPTLLRRVGKGEGRPWLGSDPAATLAASMSERYPLYELAADQVVDVDVLPVGQVARTLLAGLPDDLRPR